MNGVDLLRPKYIIKIEASSETSGTVSDTTRKITRYKIEVSAKVKIYLRGKKYDKLMYSFNESMSTPYSLILNNIRSTIASKNNAESTSIRLLSEEIYKRILIYLYYALDYRLQIFHMERTCRLVYPAEAHVTSWAATICIPLKSALEQSAHAVPALTDNHTELFNCIF